jgi:hypothetical protein
MTTSGLIHTRHAAIPWMNLEVSVPIADDGGVTSAQLLQQASAAGVKLDFPVAVRDVGSIVATDGRQVPCEADGQRIIVRVLPDGTARALGAARSIYTPVRTSEALRFLDTMRNDGAPLLYERAGILQNGRKIFLQAQVGDNWTLDTLNGQTPLKDRVTFTCGHDGTFGLKVGLSNVAIVCENTFAAASAQCEHTIKHTATATERLERAINAVSDGLQAQIEERPVLERMGKTRMSETDFAEFAIAWTRGVLKDTRKETMDVVAKELDDASDRIQTRTRNIVAELFRCFNEPEQGAYGETQYDALQAVTQYIDHQRGRAARGRQTVAQLSSATESAFWGDGAAKKRRAVELLKRW